MVQKCVVLGCGSKWYPGCSLIFHSFPKDPTRRNQWLSSVKLKNKFYETAKICSNHFVATDYVMENRLKPTAIPFYSDVLEKSELKSNPSSSVSVYYAPVRHDSILPSTPSTSLCGLSDSLAMHKESIPGSSTTMLTPIVDLEKLMKGDNSISNIPLKTAGQDDVECVKKNREVLERFNVEKEFEKSVSKVDASSSVSVYYTPAFPSTPSTSRCVLSDSLAMHEESLPKSSATMLTPIVDFEKLLKRDNLIKNIPSKTVGEDDILPPTKKICQREALEGINVENEIGDENTAPMRPSYLEKSVQVKLKTKREEMLQKRNKSLVQKFVRQKKKVNNMKSLLATIRDYTANSEIENIIKGNFANICKLFKKPRTDPRGVRYSDEVKAFALTLHFYSTKAYEFLKKLVALPHVETLRRSLAAFNCNVGFLTEVLDYLKQEALTPDKIHLKNVALIFDGMSVKKDLSPDQKTGKIYGYVDLGQITVNDPEQLATEALVFQIVSYGHYFKCPISYFFIQNCLSGDLLAELIHTAIILLHEIGITVRSLTCDGAASNIKAYESLGCSLEEDNWKPYFLHPNSITNVYCLLDAAHMLKLARNTLAEFVITSETGNISFEYIKKLHEIQIKEGLKFANRLSATHVDFKNKKMNVKLAAQVMSSSVADSLHFLKASGNPDFTDSGPTIEFLRIIDRIFDIMNSKSPFGTGYKSPLSLNNKNYWESIFNETETYLKSLNIDGQNILSHRRKKFALGFLMNITSLSSLVTDLCTMKINPLKYVLTFKYSQDNLEIFFSCIRARGRAQDNPSPLEFRYILRKLLFRNSVQPSVNANCVDYGFQSSHVLEFGKKHKSLLDAPLEPECQAEEHELDALIQSVETSPYQENILFYITGYIIKQMLTHISCKHCQNSLLAENAFQKDHLYAMNINKFDTFTTFVNRGKLHFPSVSAYKIVKYADKVFRHTVLLNKLNSNLIEKKMINIVQQHFSPSLTQLFKHPVTESITCDEKHEINLLKKNSSLFFKMRIKAYLKSQMETTLGHLRGKRQKHHKTVLFSNI